MTHPSDHMSEQELADWQYAHRDELDAEEGEPVDVEISPQLSVTMSFRLPADEADTIRAAATDSGLSLSEWIRRACAAALAEPPTGGLEDATREHLTQIMRELNDASTRIQQVLQQRQRVQRSRRMAQRARRTATNQ